MAQAAQYSLLTDDSMRVGTVAYNGYKFPPAIKSNVSFTPEYDPSGRAVVATRIDLSIETFLMDGMDGISGTILTDDDLTNPETATVDADGSVDNARIRLQQPGKELVFKDKGAGTFIVNPTAAGLSLSGADYFNDTDFGPKPKILSWEPVGSNRVVKVVWECTSRIPDCNDPDLKNFRIESFNYSVNWAIDREGMTVRRITGSFMVPIRFSSNVPDTPGSSATHTADNHRDFVLGLFEDLDCFHREHNIDLSNDRRTITFTITDTEIPSNNLFHRGMIDMDIDYSAEGSLADGGFGIWRMALGGSITVAPRTPKMLGYLAFVDILEHYTKKVERTRITTFEKNGNTIEKKETQSTIILDSFSLSEDLYGRTIRFNAGYRLMASLADFFLASGMYEPFQAGAKEAQTWDLWKTSVKHAQNPRGWQELGFNLNDDIVIDTCARNFSSILPSPPDLTVTTAPRGFIYTPRDKPDPETSYIGVNITTTIARLGSTVVHRALRDNSPVIARQADVPNPSSTEELPPFPDVYAESEANNPIVFQEPLPAEFKVAFAGSIARVASSPGSPELIAIGGAAAVKTGTDVVSQRVLSPGKAGPSTGVVGPIMGGIYVTSFKKEYTLTKAPVDWKKIGSTASKYGPSAGSAGAWGFRSPMSDTFYGR